MGNTPSQPVNDHEKLNDNWYNYKRLMKYKMMEYPYSCFPCGLHVVLANLGYVTAEGRTIEKNWGKALESMGKSLSSFPPDEFIKKQICDMANRYRDNILYYLPDNFEGCSPEAAESISASINSFIAQDRALGICFGYDHAQVLYKPSRGNYTYLCLWQKAQEDQVCPENRFCQVGTLQVACSEYNGEYALDLIMGNGERYCAKYFVALTR